MDGFQPGGRVTGEMFVPGSKSLAQRALVCAAMARGTTRLVGLPASDDVRATAGALEACGVPITAAALRAVDVTGRPPGDEGLAAPEVTVGESGTGARLLSAALGFQGAFRGESGIEVVVRATGTLAHRASPPLFAALARAGVGVVHEGPAGGWPVRLAPAPPPSDVTLDTPVSSQEASALLAALAAHPGERRLHVVGRIPSRPYLAMTIAVLGDFGARITVDSAADGEVFRVRGPLAAPRSPMVIEPDASAAAVALAAACLSGGALAVRGFGRASRQGDVRIVEHLVAFGCEASFGDGALRASGAPTRGAERDLSGEPDLAPVVAAVAAAAALGGGGDSVLTGLATLPGKESSRIEVLARALTALGLEVEADAASLRIGRPRGSVSIAPLALDPHGDHRMAFAFALLGLLRAGITVRQPECVAKSWPGFWGDLEQAGARRF